MISDTETATWWSCCVHTGDVALETMQQQGQCSCFHPDSGSCLEKPVHQGGKLGASSALALLAMWCLAAPAELLEGSNTVTKIPQDRGKLDFGYCFWLAATCGCLSHSGVRPLNPQGVWAPSGCLQPSALPTRGVSEGCLGTACGPPTGINPTECGHGNAYTWAV